MGGVYQGLGEGAMPPMVILLEARGLSPPPHEWKRFII